MNLDAALGTIGGWLKSVVSLGLTLVVTFVVVDVISQAPPESLVTSLIWSANSQIEEWSDSSHSSSWSQSLPISVTSVSYETEVNKGGTICG